MPDKELDEKFDEPWQVKYTLLQGEIRRNQFDLDQKLAIFRDEQRAFFREISRLLSHLADRIDGNPDTSRPLTYEEYRHRRRDLDDWYNRSSSGLTNAALPMPPNLPPF